MRAYGLRRLNQIIFVPFLLILLWVAFVFVFASALWVLLGVVLRPDQAMHWAMGIIAFVAHALSTRKRLVNFRDMIEELLIKDVLDKLKALVPVPSRLRIRSRAPSASRRILCRKAWRRQQRAPRKRRRASASGAARLARLSAAWETSAARRSPPLRA
jgi:hypothetical protein